MRYGFLCAWALACLAAPAAATTLSISAAPASVKVGDTFVLDVVVTDATDLYGFQFDLFFAAPVLQAREVIEGDFLAGDGSAATSFFPGFIDDTAGTVSFTANTLLGPGPGAGGGGVLARLSLQAIAPGQGSLLLGNVVLLDSTLSELAVPMLFGGSVHVTAVPEPASAALFGCGLAMLATAGRRRRR